MAGLRFRLDLGLGRLRGEPAEPQGAALAFPLAGVDPFVGYPSSIGTVAPSGRAEWTVQNLFARVPDDLAALISPDPRDAQRTLAALVERLEFYRTKMAEYQERAARSGNSAVSIETYIRLVYIQLFSEIAGVFRLDLTREAYAQARADAFVRVIRQIKLMTTADLIKVADLIQDEVLNAIIARSAWIASGDNGPAAPPPKAPQIILPQGTFEPNAAPRPAATQAAEP
ncbi:MAG TPA: hypothetical protein PLQ11_08335, partial [Beijerinckiaceae bacterium]|nr:hypothetical protein [Beijerinckiaceae bacterium]